MARKIVPRSTGSRAEQAYERIRMAILRGELPPGIVSLAAASGRSARHEHGPRRRGPAAAGKRRTGGKPPPLGYRRSPPDSRGIRGHYVVREALETQAARLFAEKATVAEREELLRAAVELDRGLRRPAPRHPRHVPHALPIPPPHRRVHRLPGPGGSYREEPRAGAQLAVQRRSRLPRSAPPLASRPGQGAGPPQTRKSPTPACASTFATPSTTCCSGWRRAGCSRATSVGIQQAGFPSPSG